MLKKNSIQKREVNTESAGGRGGGVGGLRGVDCSVANMSEAMGRNTQAHGKDVAWPSRNKLVDNYFSKAQ